MTESLAMGLLSRIERKEMELLGWGVIDGTFSWAELRDTTVDYLRQASEQNETEPDELINELMSRRLLVPDGHLQDHYRSRMAETVRLARQLRQIFPGDEGAWAVAPTLVSDYRLGISERRYPRRDISPTDFVTRFRDDAGLSDLEVKAIAALLDRGPDFQLAEFQFRATTKVYRGVTGNKDQGTVVAAGTGSGKTLAFYLPVLTWVAGAIGQDPWTKAVAIYPRVELIRDQVQAAYMEARRLDEVLAATGKPKVRIGVFFSETPNMCKSVPSWTKWRRTATGYTCPLFLCPHCSNGQLVWSHEDVARNVEQLVCQDCAGVITSDEVSLTRASMKIHPPDVLFTSAEMVNRNIYSDWNKHIFGVGVADEAKRPRFLLLDEIHVNQGTSGAHVALLMRRWRSAVKSPLSLVGLSATLEDASSFFADLLGLGDNQVHEVSPLEGELVREGMEYNLILKGDPRSGTALASTTIQTAMLMRRMLDTSDEVSEGAVGQRLYTFVDALDGVNRLYWQLMNAEGWQSSQRPLDRLPRSLAALRNPSLPQHARRWPRGQSWDSVISIGHGLDDRSSLTIGRTSSQDSGVDMDSDVIVATASVEVGFDDAKAGAVLQHKAPRQASSFVQRKGRAGRTRGMRPWTVVVLSDYGRDQAAFLQYENLFSPRLERQVLPTSNRYVLRMQAALALLGWLSGRIGNHLRGNIWTDTAKPADQKSHDEKRQEALLQVVAAALSSKAQQADLQHHFVRSLGISKEEAQAVMWEGPRAIMLEVLPTLHRRLSTKWGSIVSTQPEARTKDPLPEFIPANLFSDLLVPEVRFKYPVGSQDWKADAMGILPSLTEFSPGRVSKRFGVEYQRLSHWVPVPLTASGIDPVPLEVNEYLTDFEVLGDFAIPSGQAQEETIRCLRPLEYTLSLKDADVRDTSTSTPVWCSQLVRETVVDDAYVPSMGLLTTLITGMSFHLHVTGDQVTIRRFYRDVQIDLKSSSGGGERYLGRLVHTQAQSRDEPPENIALGYELQVDALRIRLNENLATKIMREQGSASVHAGSRRAWFEHGVQTSPNLLSHLTVFQLEWLAFLCQAAVADLVREASDDDVEDFSQLDAVEFASRLRTVLEVSVAQVAETPEQREDNATTDDEDEQGRLYRGLRAAIDNPTVVGELIRLLARLQGDHFYDAEFAAWQMNRFKATLAGAVLHTMGRINSQVDIDSLVVDLDGGPTQPGAEVNAPTEVWISESIPGGVGILEQVQQAYDKDPRRFWDIVNGVLDETTEEEVNASLTRLMEKVEESSIADSMELVRSGYSQGHAALHEAVENLKNSVESIGFSVSQTTVASLMARVLRAGSTVATDAALARVLHDWQVLEEKADFDIGARVASYVLSVESLDAFNPELSGSRQARFHLLQSLLWHRGLDARNSRIAYYSRFDEPPSLDRLLVADALSAEEHPLSIGDPAWKESSRRYLSESGSVTLECEVGDERSLKLAITEVIGTAVDVGYLLVYPRLAGIKRQSSYLRAVLNLRDVV